MTLEEGITCRAKVSTEGEGWWSSLTSFRASKDRFGGTAVGCEEEEDIEGVVIYVVDATEDREVWKRLESAVEWLDAPLGEDEQKGVVDEMEREDAKHMSVVGMKDGCWQSSLSSLVWSGGVFSFKDKVGVGGVGRWSSLSSFESCIEWFGSVFVTCDEEVDNEGVDTDVVDEDREKL